MASTSPPGRGAPPSPWFTLGNLTFLRYLHQFKPPPGVPMSEQTAQRYRYFRLGRQLFYFNMVLHVLRIAYLHYHLATGGRLLDQQPYAPLYTVLIESFHFYTSQTLLILAATMATIFITADYMICFKVDHHLLKVAYQMMMESGEQLLEINRRRVGDKPQFNWRKPIHFIQSWSALVQSIWNSSNLRFKTSQLTEFPNLSAQLRARTFVFSTAIAWISWALSFSFVLFLLAFEAAFLAMTINRLPLATNLLLIFDITFIFYFFANTFRVALLCVHFDLVASYLFSKHIRQLNLDLSRAFHQSHLSTLRYRYLHYFYREYIHLKAIAIYHNEHINSPLMAVLFSSILVASILLLSNLLFRSLLLGEKLFMVFVFVVINLISFFACFILIHLSQSFYISERLIFRFQLLLTTDNGPGQLYQRATMLTAKMQLMAFYEIICTKKPFRFTVGPFMHISKRMIYEFAYAYSGMVMYACGMIRDAQME